MWTRKRSRSASRRSPAPRRLRREVARTCSGFTLIELLVVVAIIAVLISILLPSLKCARESARGAACGATMRSLATGLGAYTSEFDEWYPGLNTSGVAMAALRVVGNSQPDPLRKGNLPVQPQDWMSPLLRYDTSLPASRARRLDLIINKFRCPSMVSIRSLLYPGDANDPQALPRVVDKEDFREIDRWAPLSYLMPVHFQFWGQREGGRALADMQGYAGMKVYASAAPDDWEVVTEHFVSRISRIGRPADKVFAADGTRYLARTGVLDHDVSPFPTLFGSFCSAGGWWSGATAYGVVGGSLNWGTTHVSQGSESEGQNLKLSYRHGCAGATTNGKARDNKGTINALFFDGHVDRLSDKQSRRIDYWYPTGSKVQSPNEGMTDVPNNYVIR